MPQKTLILTLVGLACIFAGIVALPGPMFGDKERSQWVGGLVVLGLLVGGAALFAFVWEKFKKE